MIRRTVFACCAVLVVAAQTAMAGSVESIGFSYDGSNIINPIVLNSSGIFTDAFGTTSLTVTTPFDFSAPPATASVTTPTVSFTGSFVSVSGDGSLAAPYSVYYVGIATIGMVDYATSEKIVLNAGGSSGTIELDNPPAPVPEPTSFALLGIGVVGLAVRRLRRQAAV